VSKVLSSLLGKKEYRVLILGLDNAGPCRPAAAPPRPRAALVVRAAADLPPHTLARAANRQDDHPVQAADG